MNHFPNILFIAFIACSIILFLPSDFCLFSLDCRKSFNISQACQVRQNFSFVALCNAKFAALQTMLRNCLRNEPYSHSVTLFYSFSILYKNVFKMQCMKAIFKRTFKSYFLPSDFCLFGLDWHKPFKINIKVDILQACQVPFFLCNGNSQGCRQWSTMLCNRNVPESHSVTLFYHFILSSPFHTKMFFKYSLQYMRATFELTFKSCTYLHNPLALCLLIINYSWTNSLT